MAVSEDKKRVQIAFPKELIERMDAYCKESGMSRSAYVSLLVSKDLNETDAFLIEFKKQIGELIEKLEVKDETPILT